MITMDTLHEMRAYTKEARQKGETVGLVPTLGFLHEGHGALIDQARRENRRVVVSVFVNPLQFGPSEDFSRYPRDLQKDRVFCEALGVDVVFAPSTSEMYGPDGALTRVHVATLGDHLCGASRPGHFDGVGTVVTKLFNITQPDRAYFGQKDYQQLSIVRRLVSDLSISVEIVAVDTVREADGLAKSSRNSYLTKEQRLLAPRLYEVLKRIQNRVAEGECDASRLLREARARLEATPGFRVDYLTCVDPQLLQPLSGLTARQSAVFALAVFVGNTRLIDNIAVQCPA